ncbi:hypothetical protein NNJEOMEG_00359 [Fundidesulfovibrio magnetotacticus]|uniref:BrnT family toxin n=1 Tax=Fundidesulfovibrio magnetotacticus TaxID=2730080 RepID=A0A6V8LLF2_9BACT|nr:BrnT family toxin [Fundidesulfovibrio magnetotacticus]GFK92534.1 hypothetical protein NNJEOMEG_00359 [Fundidesulfovibrio magnetotacticus]
MHFTWDERKNALNKAKHGIRFETALLAFDDPLHLSRLERVVGGEERWQTLGSAGGVVLILVAHTYRDHAGQESVRIISARKATAHERKLYEQG